MLAAILLMAAAPADARPTSEGALNGWFNCVGNAADRFAIESTETADVIAQGALGVCGSKEVAYWVALYDELREGSTGLQDTKTVFDLHKQRAYQIAVAKVLIARSTKKTTP